MLRLCTSSSARISSRLLVSRDPRRPDPPRNVPGPNPPGRYGQWSRFPRQVAKRYSPAMTGYSASFSSYFRSAQLAQEALERRGFPVADLGQVQVDAELALHPADDRPRDEIFLQEQRSLCQVRVVDRFAAPFSISNSATLSRPTVLRMFTISEGFNPQRVVGHLGRCVPSSISSVSSSSREDSLRWRPGPGFPSSARPVPWRRSPPTRSPFRDNRGNPRWSTAGRRPITS